MIWEKETNQIICCGDRILSNQIICKRKLIKECIIILQYRLVEIEGSIVIIIFLDGLVEIEGSKKNRPCVVLDECWMSGLNRHAKYPKHRMVLDQKIACKGNKYAFAKTSATAKRKKNERGEEKKWKKSGASRDWTLDHLALGLWSLR